MVAEVCAPILPLVAALLRSLQLHESQHHSKSASNSTVPTPFRP